uniref:Uncharacterized protein n=1 Tax=Candidatus Methanogaster sp. ANME-2c ERB4 TaxID=2759911 RepID=A0A7G9YKS5_9EURY|nr:hypothetical protein LKGCFIDI_00011 [Methanosarcinales archaeon ANME-2c ERB4]
MAQPKIPVKYTRRLLFFAPSRLCVIVFQFNAKAQRRRDAKGVVDLSLHVFCVVVHPTDHYGNHWIPRQCLVTCSVHHRIKFLFMFISVFILAVEVYFAPPQLELFLHKCQLDVRPEFNAILCVSATLRLRVKSRTQRRKGAETQRLNKLLDRLSCCICLGLVCSWSNWQLQKSQFMPVVSIYGEHGVIIKGKHEQVMDDSKTR